jgi:hypothetical protein
LGETSCRYLAFTKYKETLICQEIKLQPNRRLLFLRYSDSDFEALTKPNPDGSQSGEPLRGAISIDSSAESILSGVEWARNDRLSFVRVP